MIVLNVRAGLNLERPGVLELQIITGGPDRRESGIQWDRPQTTHVIKLVGRVGRARSGWRGREGAEGEEEEGRETT